MALANINDYRTDPLRVLMPAEAKLRWLAPVVLGKCCCDAETCSAFELCNWNGWLVSACGWSVLSIEQVRKLQAILDGVCRNYLPLSTKTVDEYSEPLDCDRELLRGPLVAPIV